MPFHTGGAKTELQDVKKFGFDVGWVFSSSIITLLIGFIIRPVLARWLGPDGLGLYSVIFTIYAIFLIPANLGLSPAVVKYVAQYKEKREKISKISSSGLLISLVFGAITSVVLYLLSPYVTAFFDMPELSNLIPILCIVFPLAAFFQTQMGVLNGLRKMKHFAFLIIFQQISMAFFIIMFVASGLGVTGAIIGIVFSPILPIIFGLYLLNKNKVHWNLSEGIVHSKELTSFGWKLAGANAVNEMNNRLDIILIGYFLVASDVGYYSVALVLAKFFWFIPQGIQRVTYPAVTEYWHKNNHNALNKMIDKVMKYCIVLLVLAGLGVGFFARDIITILFTEKFIYAVLPLQILLIGTVIRGMAQPIGASLSAIGRPDLPLKVSTFVIVVNILMDIFLIPRMGIDGAAIATTISLILGALISLYLTVKHLSIKVDVGWYLRMLVVVIISIALFKFGMLFVNPYLLGGIILSGCLIIMLKFFLTKEDKDMFKYLTHSLIPWR